MMEQINGTLEHETIVAYQQQLDSQRRTIAALEAELETRTRLNYSVYGVTETGIIFTGMMTFDAWVELGEVIAQERTRWQFALGDWLRYGEERYGEMYSQAIDLTRYSLRTLEDYVYVARNVEITVRTVQLSFSHHKMIASLEPDDQRRFLADAVRGDWTADDLRQAVNRFKAEARGETYQPYPPQPAVRVRLGQFKAVDGKLTIELDDGDYAVYVERLGDA